ncbi:MFS transporter [Streptomyces nodosus]|uniref:MFS transporter n=1 Tax=Streptomyces nodosus TaxID=40318 RepID=A0A0B5DJX3_9ACTN|nr:MFS transporter [Streptomyces nodosus]AJE40247.1 MFS transporter [Streptomyces nodosus]MBB4791268.1 MFS family permease [Streptomyces nodosus]QEV38829.1 MFS transporter [Streptomyces nodosus]
MTTAPATSVRGPVETGRPAHRDGNVLRWIGAYTASMMGDNVFFLALSWAAVQSGTPAQAGMVTAVSAIPRTLLMLGGGVIADRFGPRRVVIGSDAVRCAAVLTVAAVLFLADPGLWLLAVLAVVFGAVDAVFMPAVGALPARITTRDQLARVQGMRGLAIRLANVVGAPLGGLGVALGGAAAAFALAGLLIAVSVPLLVLVRIRDRAPAPDEGAPAGGGTPWQDLRDGLRYVRGHRVLAPLMLAIVLGDLGFVGPLNIGLTLLADERGWGASGMGWVLAGFGVGAGVSALVLTVRGRLPHAGRLAAVTILAGSAAIGALAQVPNLLAAVGTALLVGLLTGLSGALCGSLLQTQSDPAYLGRVSAVGGVVSLGLAPLSMPLSAAAIGAWGTGPVFVVSAAICGLGGVLALAVPDLRRAELPG